MPTYDYRCEACGHQFEHFQGMSDRLLRTCPECKKRKLKRLIGTGAGLIFKGSGFYITDYRGDGYKNDAKKDSAPGKSDAGKSDGGKSSAADSSSTKKPAAKKSKPPKGDSSG